MNSKYKVLKFKSNNFKNVDDLVSIEEPLEISIKYKNNDKWVTQILSITMRTPGHDEDLVRGFLFNEQIVQDVKHIQSIKSFGAKVGQYKIQNKILATLNNSKNINITKIKRDFLTNSSCGVCGKSSLDALEIIKTKKPSLAEPKISKKVVLQSPDILRDNQSEFSKTGGIHASGLFLNNGKLVEIREDVGRHNALDKLVGRILKKKNLNPKKQFIACSGRLNFELVQKVLMTNIGIMIGVGAPTSLAIDLANKYNMTLVGFVKKESFNIYSNKQKIII
ncbi:MAG: formate dehydrogenase accessory sulfurtransferase FdhD [Candidatus Fonsibacter ubiquis]|nr:formate dehydrogenase accessory sulfurtransferase FdhD [Candidatus Fonsibacter ubiquis]NDB38256.1 formate dehydrogenase accessory sulfurtransferase FdhD [Pseudomonadota bacterium]GDX35437.1 sulfurtransferase FdhD [Pelagibacterales bacterium]NCU51520.1 formate dehydrogenase accessory sulfurtransferase FdhD [Candidatus Fonsibacter ubiquis]NCU69374.1 formate dehydrogenase accessory sulfurtransferase FdhD [Candidatus Fonsibacter ubiquis]